MFCVWSSSVEWAIFHEPQCHRWPARSADVLDVGHVMTKLTKFENSPKIRLSEYRHAIFFSEQNWPSSVRLRRDRVNTPSGLRATCDRRWPVFEKSDFRIFDFEHLLTGSGNKNRKLGSVTTPERVSSFQKWKQRVDITYRSPAIAPPVLWKRVFLFDIWKFAKNPFPVRSTSGFDRTT